MLQFQHFSPVLNSAIGFYNYKYYLLFLFYMTLSSAWVIAATLPEVILLWPSFSGKPLHAAAADAATGAAATGGAAASMLSMLSTRGSVQSVQLLLSDESGYTAAAGLVLFTCIIGFVAALPCLAMLLFHLALIGRGRTAYEWWQMRRGRRPGGASLFDYGVLNNFALALGTYPFLWPLPTRNGIEGNGIFFPEQEREVHTHAW